MVLSHTILTFIPEDVPRGCPTADQGTPRHLLRPGTPPPAGQSGRSGQESLHLPPLLSSLPSTPHHLQTLLFSQNNKLPSPTEGNAGGGRPQHIWPPDHHHHLLNCQLLRHLSLSHHKAPTDPKSSWRGRSDAIIAPHSLSSHGLCCVAALHTEFPPSVRSRHLMGFQNLIAVNLMQAICLEETYNFSTLWERKGDEKKSPHQAADNWR